ncbi:peroxisomal targeting signal 2 receptor [Geranomyces variabilis]|uniref:Peroxin-7 n=1 Tax=Geranomyces variabilis TaxID=109894 RepID=A0AAD5XJM2_9FUNG|nr:peroxisomal targeting signal 2 receptor [Geranomyces variabilis]
MAGVLRFHTAGYNGYAIEYSPFFENRIACASAANFGIVGNGRLWCLGINTAAAAAAGPAGGGGGITADRVYDTQDGLYDCAWSEEHENQIVTSSGDGSIKLWDVTLSDFPIRNWSEHTREVFSVNWNLVNKDAFITGSWDQTIKLWKPEAPQSLMTWQEHTHCIYQTVWSPASGETFASASGDQTAKIWDVRQRASASTIHAHNAEVLALDWNKYNPNVIVTGSVDHSIKTWDVRFPSRETRVLLGHEYAVRRVKCSPHSGDVVVSASYDMTMRVWDTAAASPMVHVHDLHSEFVLGVDMSMFFEGQVATCAWDEQVTVSHVPALGHKKR